MSIDDYHEMRRQRLTDPPPPKRAHRTLLDGFIVPDDIIVEQVDCNPHSQNKLIILAIVGIPALAAGKQRMASTPAAQPSEKEDELEDSIR